MTLVECLYPPRSYSTVQIRRSLHIAAMLGRGKLVLTEAPAACPLCFDRLGSFCVRCGRT